MTAPVASSDALDVGAIRQHFPVIAGQSGGKPLIYLDSAATSQKPQVVIDAMSAYYERRNANVHRGIHRLAEEATEAYEAARSGIADFIGASSSKEVIFTKNATEALNLVAFSWGRANLKPGDIVLLTEMEHHSNLIPWQLLAAEKDLRLEFIPMTEDYLLDLDAYRSKLSEGPEVVGFTHMSNVTGTINPVAEMTRMAHEAGAVVVLDGAQSVPHMPVDVGSLDIDFMAFSGHKMCGPTGIGVLYGRQQQLEGMPPFLGGGDMIKRVRLRTFDANELPYKFEAGTPPIAEAIGLGAAVDFLREIGMAAILEHEQRIIAQAVERLEEVPGVKVYGPVPEFRGGVASFTFETAHPHDIASILDRHGVAVRAGHHCAMPLHDKLGLPATTRASFYLYNTEEEIDGLIEGLYEVQTIFG